MPMIADATCADETFNEYAECTVCRTDTALLCSPCGDPVCHNCACPNGCEAEIALEAAA
jgi:hypothetical protein